MKSLFAFVIAFTFFTGLKAAPVDSDTIPPLVLSGVEISTQRTVLPVHRLPNVHGNILIAGKKNEVIELSKSTADLATVNQRQLFARVPGLMIWENDGSGIQIGIAARGLSPNRSWEFNTRQNGYDISPDVFGYPEAYYAPPMESVERIEVLRGSSALQFGPQFGGVVNYVLKSGHGNKPFFYESRQTAGSYGLFSSYNAIGGTKNKWSYYAFTQQRRGNGWRANSAFDVKSIYGSLEYRHNANLLVGVNITHSQFLSQQPGGLTDEEYKQDWRSSSRSRNWLRVPWNVAALYSKIRTSKHSLLDIKFFGVLADRSSVGYMKAINVLDTINAETDSYNPRKLDIDEYQTWGAEMRWLLEYQLFGTEHQLAMGARYSDAQTHRRNDGVGSSGALFDTDTAQDDFGKNLFFDNDNTAAFIENIFHVGNRLTITPAVRMENLTSKTRGYISLQEGDFNPVLRKRTFVLAGLGLQYEWENMNVYANASQSYRPVTYGDFTPASTTDIIDPNLKDASGYNAEFGFRGIHKSWLNFDAGCFYLMYDNRIGTVLKDGVNFKTNIGTSVSRGIELYVEFDLIKMMVTQPQRGSLCFFVSGTVMDARYTQWDHPLIADDPLKAIENKRVEYAPEQIWRSGLTYKVKGLSTAVQWSFVDDVYTDATNTEAPSTNAQVGKIDAYNVWDASLKYEFTQSFFLQIAVNNMLDTRYATRRAGGYPGPGLMPGTGRTISCTLGLNL
jgi:Fe(3+) dicitrate transport protein